MRSGVQAAIHVEPRTGDLPGGRAGQEGDRRGDVLRLAVVTDRNHLALGFRLLPILRVHIAVGRPWMDKVNGDPARS